MSRKQLLEAALGLSADERIALAGDLWDSVAEVPNAITLTDEQRSELRRRLARHRAAPDEAIPWAEIRSALLPQS
ncbi:MAG: addiction module protein [Planctomycetes bacterium]|nr:addiction module protein [Planctomycetota bacterium]